MSEDLIPIPQPAEPPAAEEIEAQDPVLSIAQRRGLLALLTHPNIRQAAKSVGVHERTLRRWLENPTFRSALDAFLESGRDDLLHELEQGAFTAVDTLRRVCTYKDSDVASRIKASKHLLDFCERRTLRYDLVTLLRRP